jgi:hypothetical protein
VSQEGVKKAPHSASIDDLRVIQVLLKTAEEWDRPGYEELAMKIADSLKKRAVRKGLLLHQTVLEGEDEGPFIVDISYLDLTALRLLSEKDPDWQPIYDRSLEVLKGAELKNGFFYEKYDVDRDQYYFGEKNLINQLISAIHLEEEGTGSRGLLNFLEEEWRKHGRISGSYDPETGKALVRYENPAVYGLLMRYALLAGRNSLFDKIEKRVRKTSVQNKKSVWYGSLCRQGCHSFDHLQILLSLLQNERK